MAHGHHGHGGRHGHHHGNEHGHAHGEGGDAPRDAHGNPLDMSAYLDRLESPERAAWQKPDEVVAALGLAAGAVVADVGAGPGYLTLRLARAVGPSGRVFGVDVDPRMTALLAERAAAAGLGNVEPVLAPSGDGLPPRPCDLILIVNAFHHFPDGAGYLRRLSGALAPGGRIALIDFHDGDLPVGPPPEHRVTRVEIDRAVAAAGLALDREVGFLPYQHFLLLGLASAAKSGDSPSP
jgi:SAM-dependent methyltransferase